MIKIPQSGKITQDNKSDKVGILYKTRNMNLSKEGYLKMSPRMISVMNTDDNAEFDNADAMILTGSNMLVVGDKVFEGDVGLTTLTENAETNFPSPGAEESACLFAGKKVVSDGAGIVHATTGAWTAVGLSLSTTNPTSLHVFEGKSSLMVGNNNIVKLLDSSFAVTQTLTLPAEFKVTSLASNGATAYVATRHANNGNAQLFTWDGNGSAASASYPVGCFELSTIKAYDSSIAGITSLGQLVRFTGGGFSELAVLPIYNEDEEWADSNNDHSKVSDLGMAVDGSVIYIMIDGSTSLNYPRRVKSQYLSGLWCYDPDVGLYHHSSPSYSTISTQTIVYTTDINTTTNVITVTTAPITGSPVYYDKSSSSTAIGGLKDDKLYYTIKLTGTTIKLAESATDATAGTAIDLTSTGDGNHKLHFIEVYDYGWTYTNNRQSVAVMTSEAFNTNLCGRLAITGHLDVAGTDKYSLCGEFPALPNISSFETARVYSDEVEDAAVQVHLKYQPLTDDDEIVIKIKDSEREGIPIMSPNESDTSTGWRGTWSDTDTFTTTVDLTDVQAGDEIEIIAGKGAGFTAHVSGTPSSSSGTWTVNLDEAFDWAVATNVFYFKVDNYKKKRIVSKTNQDSVGYTTFNVDNSGKFLQFKVELRGVGLEIQEFVVNNKIHKPLISI